MTKKPADRAEVALRYVLHELNEGERKAFEHQLEQDADLASLVRDIERGLARYIDAATAGGDKPIVVRAAATAPRKKKAVRAAARASTG